MSISGTLIHARDSASLSGFLAAHAAQLLTTITVCRFIRTIRLAKEMYEYFLATSRPSLSYIPDDILIRIFAEFSLVEWTTDVSECGRWPLNPIMSYSRQLDNDNVKHLQTKLALSLVSRRFNELATRLLYEFIHIGTIQQLQVLDRCLHRLPVLAIKMARYTKRLDIVPTTEPTSRSLDIHYRTQSLRRVRPFYELAMRIWSACPNMTHLTISTMQEILPDELTLTKSIRLHCPKLQVISWRYGPVIEHLDLLESFVTNLRVFDLSRVAGLHSYTHVREKIPSLQMPHLHTLRGPLSIVCEDFRHFELPMLRTVIIEHDSTEGSYSEEDGEAFFSRHGAHIRNFITRSPELDIKLSLLPNLQRLVFRIGEDILSKAEYRQHNASLECIGLLDILLADELIPQERDLMDGTLKGTETVVQQLLRAKEDDFPNLKCVQFLGQWATSYVFDNVWPPLLPAIRDLVGAGLEIKDFRGVSYADKLAARKKKNKVNTPSKTLTPMSSAKAKHVSKRRVPRFAKEYPKLSVYELTLGSDSTDTALAKKFDFSLSLGSVD